MPRCLIHSVCMRTCSTILGKALCSAVYAVFIESFESCSTTEVGCLACSFVALVRIYHV